MESALSKYQQNKQEMMTPILPADVNGPSISNISSLSNHFSAAAGMEQSAPAPQQQSLMDMNAKQELAASSNAVGQTLNDQTQSIKVQPPQSTVGELAGRTWQMGGELLSSLFGSQKPEAPENDLELNAPKPQHTMAMRPSTGGMMGA